MGSKDSNDKIQSIVSDQDTSDVSGSINVVVPTKVIVHPIVLLSVVDHYNRVAKDTKNRVVGVLLGSLDRKTGVYEATSSYAGLHSFVFFSSYQ